MHQGTWAEQLSFDTATDTSKAPGAVLQCVCVALSVYLIHIYKDPLFFLLFAWSSTVCLSPI